MSTEMVSFSPPGHDHDGNYHWGKADCPCGCRYSVGIPVVCHACPRTSCSLNIELTHTPEGPVRPVVASAPAPLRRTNNRHPSHRTLWALLTIFALATVVVVWRAHA